VALSVVRERGEDYFRTLVANASDILTVLEVDGTIRYVSPAVERTLGYRPEERVGRNCLELIHPDDEGRARDALDEALRIKGVPVPVEVRARHRDGSWRHMKVSLTNLLDDPSVRAVVLDSRDITQRRLAEEALEQSEARYRTLVEQIPAITYIETLDPGGSEWNVTYVSPQVEDLLGYPASEWLSGLESWEKIIHPEDRERVMAEDARAEETGEPFRMEYRAIARDGGVVWVRDEAAVVRDEESRPLFWQGIMYDITEQKRTEEKLRHTLNALLTLHEGGRVLSSTLRQEEICSWLVEIVQRTASFETGAVLLDEPGQPLNPQCVAGSEDLWGAAQSAPEALAARSKVLEGEGRQLFGLRRPGSGEELRGLCQPLRAGGRLVGLLEAYGPETLAREEVLETVASLAGQAASALANARLYGELAEREQELRRLVRQVLRAQEEERRRIAYEVHDGLAQTAAGSHQLLQAFARQHTCASARSQRQLDRALELIQQTVRDARQVIADLRPTALDDFGLAAAIHEQTKKLAEDNGRRVEYEETLGDERLPDIVETTLYRVAQEALTNAGKHAPAARVRVTLKRREGSVCLRVRDWGAGFDPDAVASGGGPGERVGLSSMRERVALLGGGFEIRSEPGNGTEVVAEIRLSGTGI
jgi:PAS domain S-box-containing protein